MTAQSAVPMRITLHLARTHDFPEGSAQHGYEFIAPLNSDDRIDAHAWREIRDLCTVERFWGREPPLRGKLLHRPGGVEGATWTFDYDLKSDGDEEAGFRFADHAFREGDYVSIRDPEGETRSSVSSRSEGENVHCRMRSNPAPHRRSARSADCWIASHRSR